MKTLKKLRQGAQNSGKIIRKLELLKIFVWSWKSFVSKWIWLDFCLAAPSVGLLRSLSWEHISVFYLWIWCVGEEFLFLTLSRSWQLSLSWYIFLTWPLTGCLDIDWYIDGPKYHFCPYTLLKHIKYKHSFNSPSNAPTVLLPQAKQDWIHFHGLPLTYRSMGGVCSPWILTMKCYI